MCTNTGKNIQDEVHFLFTCDLYDDLREILFKKKLQVIPDVVNMLALDKQKILFNDY